VTDFLGFLFLAFFITAVTAAVVWLIYRRVMGVVHAVQDLIKYYKNKKEKQ
jgi:uncharacterized membrane protein